MKISDYYISLHEKSKSVLDKSVNNEIKKLGKMHDYSTNLMKFELAMSNKNEKEILNRVAVQLEVSSYNVILGLYRQGIYSLRLALELGLSAVYFSIYQMEFEEWMNNHRDVKWASLIDKENGILSKRFAQAFCSECIEDIQVFNDYAKVVYRELSEYVHGNSLTWSSLESGIKFNKEIFNFFYDRYEVVCKVLYFINFCRYSKRFTENDLNNLVYLADVFNNIDYIREKFELGADNE